MQIQDVRKLVINLPHREDRLVQFRRELPKLFFNPEFEIIPGVPGNIVEAHKTALQYARYCGWPEVLVMEDDLRLSDSPQLISYANAAFAAAPAGFGILAGGIYNGTPVAVSEYWSEVKHFAGAHFLVYRACVYDAVINYDFGLTHYDRGLSSVARVGVINKFIATQHNGYSDHRKKNLNDDHYLHKFKMLV